MQTVTPRQTYRTLHRLRSAVQIFSLLFLFAVPLLNLLGIHALLGTLYSLSLGGVEITDPLMVLQTILLTKQIYLPLLLGVILPVLLALVFGRVFCSWMCPQNTLSEWLDTLLKRFARKPWQRMHRRLIASNPSPARYWAIFVAILLMTFLVARPVLNYLSLPGIISSAISQSVLHMSLGFEIIFVLIILGSEVFLARRYWCKYICPVGATLAVFRGKATMHLEYDATACACHAQTAPCHYACPLQLSPKRDNVYPYCFNCGLCLSACEKTGNAALTFSFQAQSTQARNAN